MYDCSVLHRSAIGIAIAVWASACGGAVTSGVAVGQAGRGLSTRATVVPQGAQVCALQDAVSTTNTAAEKPSSEVCAKALKSDLLWRKAMIVLAAHADTLEAIASGQKPETAGRVQAAGTGVQGSSFMEVEAADVVARDAVAQLARELADGTAKGDLAKAVKDAGPHVRTLCDGLTAYFDTQARALSELSRDVEKKRTAHGDRRCGALDTRSICVNESVIDRMVYANVYGQATLLERNHIDAREALAGFCAAHRKLEEAADHGDLSSDKTYNDVVQAVAGAHRAQEPAPAAKPKK